ncbi:threonine synthase [Clostridium sp. CX1]|uniref:Threonine synthase n=1 Tax=Clostridium tanneri TaxID=3037988 RepID=A0ABU4JSF6_9CLOT|nr:MULTISPECIES: threonine synthase [unclassified Clostridium]MCT8977768.1 threonine synthase [Clostridium sp. CX1]MDW8800873.1 threonine synthase [Clostridium sp. A1-XYC3]
MKWMGLIENYREFLPVNEGTRIISLCEGNTPLIRAENIEKLMPGLEIYLKYEGLNPTGSFKDRGMTMAVTKAVEEGSKAIICASTGNTSAAAAAYAAKAGIKSIVIIPNKKIAMGKLAQALAYGAKVIAIDGNFDDALNMVKEISEKHPITLVNSINPYRIEGQKTAAFELCEQLGESPDYVSIPVGNAGNITAYWKGFMEYKEIGKIDNLPKMIGFQAEGAAPIVNNKVVENPETIATAIRIGNPASWKKAVSALVESKGVIDKISDEEILKAYKMLASLEGIFAEPASCISIAGLYKLYKEGRIKGDSKVVCILTGNGLKDPDTAVNSGGDIVTLPCDFKVIEEEIIHK